MPEWLWGAPGGRSLFDPYSLQHVVWFFAITIVLASFGLRRLWAWAIVIAVSWEFFEWWVVDAVPSFPFVGREEPINKVVGDPISDFLGFVLAHYAMRAVYAVRRRMRGNGFQGVFEQAKGFATRVHGKQMYGEFPYTHHLFATSDVLEKFGFSPEDSDNARRLRAQRLVVAAVLHDTLEDTSTKAEEIVQRFGQDVADLVEAVTNEPGRNRRERFAATVPKIRANPDATVLKLADRIANVVHALQTNPDMLRMYRREWPAFEAVLRKPGECDAMWEHLASILGKAS